MKRALRQGIQEPPGFRGFICTYYKHLDIYFQICIMAEPESYSEEKTDGKAEKNNKEHTSRLQRFQSKKLKQILR